MENDRFDDYFDPLELYQDKLEHWSNYWVQNSISENLLSILKKVIYLPNKFDFYPLIVAYLMTPTRACRVLPILVCTGQAGTGKSTLISFFKEFRKAKVHTSLCTYASLRNSINSQRYYDIEQPKYEKEGVILLWDNLRINHLINNPELYQLLLLGYNYRTATMSVASQGGKNLSFNTFCPKILSTIDSFHTFPEFTELYRRLWVIPHQKLSNSLFCNLKIDQINWSGFSSNYFDFWGRNNTFTFVDYRHKLLSLNPDKYQLPSEIWELCIDVIASGLSINLWQNTSEAISYFENYYQWFKNDVLEKSSNLEKLIKIYLANEWDEKFKVINPKMLKNYINDLGNRGLIDSNIKYSQIQETMSNLGFKLTPEGWIKNE